MSRNRDTQPPNEDFDFDLPPTSDPDPEPAQQPDVELVETDLTDEHDRRDYVAVDGRTVVSVFTFADGSSMKAWTRDNGKTYTTRDISALGKPSAISTKDGLTAAEVNARAASLAADGSGQ